MLTAVVNEEAYDAIEFDLDIEYEGTETSDVLTVEGRWQYGRLGWLDSRGLQRH